MYIHIKTKSNNSPAKWIFNYWNNNAQEAQLLLRDRATFVSFENVVILSSE